MKNLEEIKKFLLKYKGGIIGGFIAIIFIFTGLLKLCVTIGIIIIGFIFGNYIQRNKELVKENLKKFIDRF